MTFAVAHKRWLTLKQAAAYASLGEARLVRMARAGDVKGFQDMSLKTRPWIFDVLSLDAYREAQATVCIPLPHIYIRPFDPHNLLVGRIDREPVEVSGSDPHHGGLDYPSCQIPYRVD